MVAGQKKGRPQSVSKTPSSVKPKSWARTKQSVTLRPLIILATIVSLSCLSMPPRALAQSTNASQKAEIIDRQYFFKQYRQQFRPIRENESYLVGRYETIFNWWDKQPHKDLRWLAYILATTYHETGRRIKAVRECFAKSDAAAIACVTKMYRRGRIKRNYAKVDRVTGKSYFGRGHVQLTWDWNYKRMGKELGMGDQIYVNPDLALDKDISIAILGRGMVKGLFTSHRLSKYFNNKRTSWGGARRIVNGMDKSKLIGNYGRKFHAALKTIPSDKPIVEEDPCAATSVPQSCLTAFKGDIERLKNQYDDLNKRHQIFLSENVQLKETIKQQKTTIEELKSQDQGPSDDLAQLHEKYNTLETRFASLEQENKTSKAENDRLKAQNTDLRSKLDQALTDDTSNPDNDLLKQRLAQVEQRFSDLNKKLLAVAEQQQKLDKLNTSLEQKQAKIDTQIQDIELSRLALQSREKGLLKELKGLQEKENSLDEEEQVLKIEENRLKQYESDLNKKQQELEDYYSKSWYTRVWDNVSSTWRNE